ncbi:MAG: c-type cytochrome [Bryobacteraceae bacterium]
MRILVTTLVFLLPLCAQEQGKKRQLPNPTNLKVLHATTAAEILPIMRSFTTALGVRCSFCHVEGNFASDENPKKEVARHMILMARDINQTINTAAKTENKRYVSCYTCHRGDEVPKVEPEAKPAQ